MKGDPLGVRVLHTLSMKTLVTGLLIPTVVARGLGTQTKLAGQPKEILIGSHVNQGVTNSPTL